VGLFNRAKVYLYDSAEYWAQQRVSEGFGLQPMEALACGCQVFSSVNGGLSDYLDPGFNCYKIAGYSQEYDIKRILTVIENPLLKPLDEQVLAEYRYANIIRRLKTILADINEFFDHSQNQGGTIPSLTKTRLAKLMFKRLVDKLWQT
jgi:glycosyltransferase involved in cell wall biosynthesis